MSTATWCSFLGVEPQFLSKVVRYQDQELKVGRSEELSPGVLRKKWFPFSILSFSTWISVCLGRNLHIGIFHGSTLVNLLAHRISFPVEWGLALTSRSFWLDTGSEQINKAGSSRFERQHSVCFSTQEIQQSTVCLAVDAKSCLEKLWGGLCSYPPLHLPEASFMLSNGWVCFSRVGFWEWRQCTQSTMRRSQWPMSICREFSWLIQLIRLKFSCY